MAEDNPTGIPVDATGGPTFDPTKNVLDLVAAAVQRQDDLRNANNRLSEVRIQCQKEISELQEKHAKEMREMETKRLDAVHQVAVLAGTTAADRAQVAIQTLAATAATERETLRSMVANSAQTLAAQNAAQQAALTERISALEKTSYEGTGRRTMADPMMVEVVAEMKAMRTAQATGGGKSEGVQSQQTTQATSNSFVVAVVAVIVAVGGLIVAFIK